MRGRRPFMARLPPSRSHGPIRKDCFAHGAVRCRSVSREVRRRRARRWRTARRLLLAHRSALADPAINDGVLLRGALVSRLSALYRRAALDPAAAFIFLALSALDMERLRGELLRRAIFPRLGLAA